jgi:hypothetical protein
MRIECPQYGHGNGRGVIRGNWNYKIPAISAQCLWITLGIPIAINLPVNDDYRRRLLKPLLAEVQEQCAK